MGKFPPHTVHSICLSCFRIIPNVGVRHFMGFCYTSGLLRGRIFILFMRKEFHLIPMSKGIRFLEDIALADLAFDAWGETPSELFIEAGGALVEAMVNPRTVGTQWTHEVRLVEPTLHDLLFEWLSTFVFLKDAEAVLFHDVPAEVWQDAEAKTWHVCGTLVGDSIDVATQELRADVKAITKHLYEVHAEPGHYRARVVLDV